MPLIEFYQAYSQFSKAFKLVWLAIFGPKSNIQILEEVRKAILVKMQIGWWWSKNDPKNWIEYMDGPKLS